MKNCSSLYNDTAPGRDNPGMLLVPSFLGFFFAGAFLLTYKQPNNG